MQRARNIAAVVMAMAGLTLAQSVIPTEQETIRTLVQQVRELQEKVQALEAKANTVTAPEPPTPSQPAEEASKFSALAEAGVHQVLGIQWRGFGEVDYKALDQRIPELGAHGFVPGSAANFFVGDLDLFLTSRINEKTSVLAEMVIGEGDAQSFNVDLERVLLKYDYNDHLKMSFGRYHTGIGYYNTAFHSGQWLQTTADRPLIMAFASHGGLLPTQAVGLSLTGLIPSGKLGLNYIAEYGSSDTVRPDINGRTVDDENNGNLVNVGVFVRPDAIPGLQVGASLYHDKISDFARGPSVRLGQTIANVHAVYVGRGIEFLNEGFLIRHAYEQHGPVYYTSAFYTQLSKAFGSFRPFVRYQYINANAQSIFEDVDLREGPSFGVRYDFNDNLAFKTQLDHTVRKAEPDLNGLQLQLAFTF
jgi:hypothetical protein